MKCLMFSADFVDVEEEEPSKFDKWIDKKLGDNAKTFAIYLSVIIATITQTIIAAKSAINKLQIDPPIGFFNKLSVIK